MDPRVKKRRFWKKPLERAADVAANGKLPASYLAIVDQSDPDLLGTTNAKEEGSFHVIEGRW